jgi:ribosomal RNA-processing protein 36
VEKRLSKVSFGALAKAHDQIAQQQANRKRKRGDGTSGAQEDKLQALRERLREIKAQKQATDAKPSKQSKPSAKAHQARKEEKKHDDDIEDEDADEGSDSDAAPHARSSKHAPAVQSSKRAVTRRRNVVETKQAKARDPRFDNISGTKPDENLLQKRYGFLDDYKASEMAELKAAIRKTKNEEDKEKLKRKLLSMESQKKAKDAKEKQQEIAQEHKKKERELIKQGKNPFYLKKGEQKKLALVDRFQNMKSKQRDKVMERRRKKVASKERKNMPAERRGA